MSRREDEPTAEVVDARLRACAALSVDFVGRGGSRVEMTAEAITQRLMEASEVSALCFALASISATCR